LHTRPDKGINPEGFPERRVCTDRSVYFPCRRNIAPFGPGRAHTVGAIRADDPASCDRRFYQFAGISISPKPIERPGPPVWVGADTVESVARVPEFGDAWIASGRHTRTFLTRRTRPTRWRADVSRVTRGPRTRQAEAEMKEAFRSLYESYARWGQPGERYDLDFDELKQERILVGSPERLPNGSMSTATSSACPSCGSASTTPAWIQSSP
jgi:hypothetical protein